MRTRRARALVAVGLVAVMAASLVACSSDSGSGDAAPPATAKPADPALTTALHAAAAAMSALPSYQTSGTIVSGGLTTTVVTDVVAPDRFHQSALPPDGPVIETTYIGSDVWSREGTGAWQSTPGAPGPDPDTIALFTALQDATVVSGTSTDILFRLEPGSPFLEATGAEQVAGQATITDGRISHIYYGLSGGSEDASLVTLDVASFGTGLPVDPPI